MSHKRNKSDRKIFLDALAIWDRPEAQLYGKVFENDVDTDAIIDRAFTLPSAGFLRD